MTTREAALVLGVPEEQIREMQTEGILPEPIPDDHFDAVIQFRLELEKAMRRKFDRHGGADSVSPN
jgi:hypothetical protein